MAIDCLLRQALVRSCDVLVQVFHLSMVLLQHDTNLQTTLLSQEALRVHAAQAVCKKLSKLLDLYCWLL